MGDDSDSDDSSDSDDNSDDDDSDDSGRENNNDCYGEQSQASDLAGASICVVPRRSCHAAEERSCMNVDVTHTHGDAHTHAP
jgi:hypothetical protein